MAVKIEPAFLAFIRDAVSAKVNNAMITVNGATVIRPITQTKHTTEDLKTTLQLYVYLDDVDAAGTITQAQLVDVGGTPMLTSDAQITSHETGTLLMFEIPFEVGVR